MAALKQWTWAELTELDCGLFPYLGAPWLAAVRSCLDDIRRQWPEIKDDAQRRKTEAGILRMIALITERKDATEGVKGDWERFRNEADKLCDEWNDLWFFGWPKGSTHEG